MRDVWHITINGTPKCECYWLDRDTGVQREARAARTSMTCSYHVEEDAQKAAAILAKHLPGRAVAIVHGACPAYAASQRWEADS